MQSAKKATTTAQKSEKFLDAACEVDIAENVNKFN